MPIFPLDPKTLNADNDAAAEAGRALAAQLQERRLALQQASVELDEAMRAEETEIDQIRDRLTPQQFEERLRDFDQRVRQVRRESQEALQTLQEQVNAARRQLEQSLNLVLRDILEARGASVLVNAQTVIMAREEIDITAEAIRSPGAAVCQRLPGPAGVGYCRLGPRLPAVDH